MRPTGIVKKIDDCGRVVIPKEVRKKIRVAAGDELELFILKKGGVAFVPLNLEQDKVEVENIANAIVEYQEQNQEEYNFDEILEFAREYYRNNK